MKKNIILVLIMISAMGISAQMYVGFGLGYHGAANSAVLGTSENTTGDISNIYGSQGKGILPEFRFGYMIDDNWGFEFGLSYLMGSNQLVVEDNNPSIYDSYKEEVYSKATMIRFAPQLVYKTDMGIYSRVGLYIPLSGKTMVTRDVSVSMMSITQATHVEIEYHGAFTTGYTGALGYAMDFNDNISFFGEFQFIGLRIFGKTSSITAYTVDGTDKMSTLKTIQKETEYVDEVKSTDNTDVDVALKSLKSGSTYSSFGFNIGLNYKF